MKQKEIWLVNLDPAIGAEIRKKRPCLILNNDAIGILPLKVIAPLTDFKDKYEIVPWMVSLDPDKKNGLNKRSVIDCFQVRSLSEERLIRKIGSITNERLNAVLHALKIVFNMI